MNKLLPLALIAVLLLASCTVEEGFVRKNKGPKTASLDELVARYNEIPESVTSITGDVTINFFEPGMRESKGCEGVLYFEAMPEMLRIDGYEKTPQLFQEMPKKYFTVLTRGGRFWVDQPGIHKPP